MLEFVMRFFKPTTVKFLITLLLMGIFLVLYQIWKPFYFPIVEFAPEGLGFPFTFIIVGPYDVCETCSVFHFVLWGFVLDLVFWHLIVSLLFKIFKKGKK